MTPVFQVRMEYRNQVVSFNTRQLIIAKGRRPGGTRVYVATASHQDGKLHVFRLGR